jgi:hypothetical protein
MSVSLAFLTRCAAETGFRLARLEAAFGEGGS